MIPSVASNTHHTLTAASADSRAGGGRRWDSGLEGAPELWSNGHLSFQGNEGQ